MRCECDKPVPNVEDKSEKDLTETQMDCKVNCLEQKWTRERTNFGTAKSLRASQEANP